VRLRETIGKAMTLKSSTDINQWVNPRNNHHVLIYRDYNGNLQEQVVQFWTVVERRVQGLPTYILPEDGKEMVVTLETNDMFLLGLSSEDYHVYKENYGYLSQHLYRVQKISESYYNFRYHLASTLLNDYEEKRIQSFKAWETLNPIKVKISELGGIIRVR
jgi:CRISPR-associated endonuclease Csn1